MDQKQSPDCRAKLGGWATFLLGRVELETSFGNHVKCVREVVMQVPWYQLSLPGNEVCTEFLPNQQNMFQMESDNENRHVANTVLKVKEAENRITFRFPLAAVEVKRDTCVDFFALGSEQRRSKENQRRIE